MSRMSGRELLLNVLYQQPGDRIPVSPFIHVNYVKEFFGTHDVDWVEKTPEVYRHFGFDIMHRNCTPIYDAYGQTADGGRQTADWQLEIETQQDGRDETRITSIHTPRGDLDSVEALRWIYEYDAESSPTKYFIKTEADLDVMMKYLPPITTVDTHDIQRAKEATGEDGVVAPWIQGAFNLICIYYRKVDDLLMDAKLNPEFFHKIMSWGLERYKTHIQQVIDARPDVISYAGNIANGKMVGPAFFKETIWPYEKAFIEFIQSQGVAVLYHNCGYARKLLPLYPGLGMRAYESMTPSPHGDTVLENALQIFGEGVTLLGNIDQIDLLRYNTPADVRDTVRQVLETVRGRSHFILATTDYFNENTPHENVHALAQAGHDFGTL